MGGSVSLIDGHIDIVKSCENCVYYDTDRKDMPCCTCYEYKNFEGEIEEK